ncbi:MAG: SWIM zinc finger family protein [Cyanobacteria bacterium J06648_16]
MPLSPLKIATVKNQATQQSFERGEQYFSSGAVGEVTLRGQTLSAEVEGNSADLYRVTVTVDDGGVTAARCSCPYSFEGWCKHIVATLLLVVRQPGQVAERPSLDDLLKKLDLAQAKALIRHLVEADVELQESVDFFISLQQAKDTAPAKKGSKSGQRRTTVDASAFKRRIRHVAREVLHQVEEGWEEVWIEEEIQGVVDDALTFAERGDGYNAMVVLEGITEGYAEYADELNNYGLGPEDNGIDLDDAWAEAILCADLTDNEQLIWQEKLKALQDQLIGLPMALEALRQGWDYEPLVNVLRGHITEKGAWRGEAPSWADDFSLIRLKILAQQQRYEEYLYLAEAEGQTEQYLSMLGQLGRVDEAIIAAQEEMETLAEAKSLAEILREQGKWSEALAIAMQGLRLEREPYHSVSDFALWTSELAEELGDTTAALEARQIVFQERPSFQDYQRIELLAEESWPQVQEKLLTFLRGDRPYWADEARVDIFLHEGLLENAIAAVSPVLKHRSALVLRVMDAVVNSHSQWVINNAKAQADPIVSEGRSNHYRDAIEWLKRLKAAHRALDQETDWLRYRRQLADTHGRKRKLMELLQQARL